MENYIGNATLKSGQKRERLHLNERALNTALHSCWCPARWVQGYHEKKGRVLSLCLCLMDCCSCVTTHSFWVVPGILKAVEQKEDCDLFWEGVRITPTGSLQKEPVNLPVNVLVKPIVFVWGELILCNRIIPFSVLWKSATVHRAVLYFPRFFRNVFTCRTECCRSFKYFDLQCGYVTDLVN